MVQYVWAEAGSKQKPQWAQLKVRKEKKVILKKCSAKKFLPGDSGPVKELPDGEGAPFSSYKKTGYQRITFTIVTNCKSFPQTMDITWLCRTLLAKSRTAHFPSELWSPLQCVFQDYSLSPFSMWWEWACLSCIHWGHGQFGCFQRTQLLREKASGGCSQRQLWK